MASSSKILVVASDRPVYGVPELDAANAEKVTTLLQESQFTYAELIRFYHSDSHYQQTMTSTISSSAPVAFT